MVCACSRRYYDQYRFQISAMLPTSVTSDAKADTVFDSTFLVTINLPQIKVGSFILESECRGMFPRQNIPNSLGQPTQWEAG